MKCPRVPTFTLFGIDAKIQLLQVSLGTSLDWLTYSFGRSYPYSKDVNGTIETYPVVFVDNTTDPQDMRPDDNCIAMAFWTVADPGRIEYDNQDIYSAVKSGRWEYDVSLIVWVNLKRLDSSSYNETKSQLRQQIVDALQKKLYGVDVMFTPVEIFDQDVEQVYEGYDLSNPESVMKGHFVAFRVAGVLTFKSTCPISTTYSVTNCT